MKYVYPELSENVRKMISDGLLLLSSKGLLSLSDQNFLVDIASLLCDRQIEVKLEEI